MKVLHVITSELQDHFGGLEAWLFEVGSHIDRSRFELHFLNVAPRQAGANYINDKLREIGLSVTSMPVDRLTTLTNRRAKRIAEHVRRHGPFDAIHSHLEFGNGAVMSAVRSLAPVRISHFHVDRSIKVKNQPLFHPRTLYRSLARRKILRYSTQCLACSDLAGRSVIGPEWDLRPTCAAHLCGVNFREFQPNGDLLSRREELGLRPTDFVIGTVGRIAEPKNHGFLVEVLKVVRQTHPHVKLLIIGSEGDRAQTVYNLVERYQLGDAVIFAGPTEHPKVVEYLKSCLDIFVFPSLWEGFGIALVEAQAAGLRCLVSTACTREVEMLPELVTRLDVTAIDSVEQWAQAIREMLREPRAPLTPEKFERIIDSRFSIRHSIKHLESCYENQPGGLLPENRSSTHEADTRRPPDISKAAGHPSTIISKKVQPG